MPIILAKNSGFCSGVRRAYFYIKNYHQKFTPPLKIYGDLVHNTQVAKETKEWGIATIKKVTPHFKGTFIIPTHGIDQQTLQKIKTRKIKIVDMTCPRVLKAINKARILYKKNKKILILGDKNHTEVKAIASAIKENKLIFPTASKLIGWLMKNKKNNHCGIVFQTTSNFEEYEKIKSYCRKKLPSVEILDTICPATKIRQNEAQKIAQKVDQMLVIGSKASANSNRLYQLCKKVNPKTYFFDNASQINKKKLFFGAKIGITAGASTPDYVINAVIKKIKALEKIKNCHHKKQ